MTEPGHPEGDNPRPRTPPPQLAVWLLSRALPPHDAEFALGDLEEDFHAVRASRGAFAAHFWFWSQTARVLGL